MWRRDEPIINAITRQDEWLGAALDERSRRFWAATEARELGSGGVMAVATATGVRERTMRRGSQDLQHLPPARGPSPGRRRRQGGGRQPLPAHAPALMAALEALVEPTTRGDPMSPLRGTWKSTRQLAQALLSPGHLSSQTPVAHLLTELGDSVQGTRTTQDGSAHPDREAPFHSINQQGKAFPKAGHPVIAVEATKKEGVGDLAIPGRESQPQGPPERVRVDDVLEPA